MLQSLKCQVLILSSFGPTLQLIMTFVHHKLKERFRHKSIFSKLLVFSDHAALYGLKLLLNFYFILVQNTKYSFVTQTMQEAMEILKKH